MWPKRLACILFLLLCASTFARSPQLDRSKYKSKRIKGLSLRTDKIPFAKIQILDSDVPLHLKVKKGTKIVFETSWNPRVSLKQKHFYLPLEAGDNFLKIMGTRNGLSFRKTFALSWDPVRRRVRRIPLSQKRRSHLFSVHPSPFYRVYGRFEGRGKIRLEKAKLAQRKKRFSFYVPLRKRKFFTLYKVNRFNEVLKQERFRLSF